MRTFKFNAISLGAALLMVLVAGYALLASPDDVNVNNAEEPVMVVNTSSESNDHVYTELLTRLTELQEAQVELLAANLVLHERIEWLEKNNSVEIEAPERDIHIDTEFFISQVGNYREEQRSDFENAFEDSWSKSSYEEVDESWLRAMQDSLDESQSLLNQQNLSTTSLNYLSCGLNSCTAEFLHSGDVTNDQQLAFLDEFMPSAAKQVMYKHVFDGHEPKTYAIYMR